MAGLVERLIRRMWGTLTLPKSLDNKQVAFNEGDDGQGLDLTEMVARGPTGIDHVFTTEAKMQNYVNTQIANNALTTAIEYGKYTPVATNLVNVSDITFSTFNWSKVGNSVRIWGVMSIDLDGEAIGSFELSKPATSVFNNSFNAVGSAKKIIVDSSDVLFTASANTTNDTIEFTSFLGGIQNSVNFNVEADYEFIGAPPTPP